MKNCHGLGHGSHTTDYTSYTTELQRTKILPLYSPQQCEKALNDNYFLTLSPSITWTAHESHLCAGGEEFSDTCEGDGGGPLVCAAVPEKNEEEISAGEGGVGTVDYSEPDPIFGEFENEYESDEVDPNGEVDEVFEGDDYPEGDTDVFGGDSLYGDYDYPCDDTEDTLGLRENPLCQKGAQSSTPESGKVKARLCPT